jgi:hypothetical protein
MITSNKTKAHALMLMDTKIFAIVTSYLKAKKTPQKIKPKERGKQKNCLLHLKVIRKNTYPNKNRYCSTQMDLAP